MTKLGRNDPCPCGSGKKYKQCCLNAGANQAANDRSRAVPRAIDWLMTKHGKAAREALDEGFFGSLDDDEYDLLPEPGEEAYEGIMINALEWLLADGVITIKGEDHRVADLLLGRVGPLFSVEQRQWIELLTAMPLRLYEVVEVRPGESMTLKDVLLPPESEPCLVQEKSVTQQANRYDILAARLLPVEDHFELSGAVYSFPRAHSQELLEELTDQLEGVEPGSPLAEEITSVIIPHHWLQLFVSDFEIPELIDQVTGESLLFVTDHYRVHDWEALEKSLGGEADLEGDREEGWRRIFEGDDGLMRSSLSIDPGKRPDRIKVSYCTEKYADDGRPWFEALAGAAVTFVTREISDPKGMLANIQSEGVSDMPVPPALPPETLTELFEQRIRQLYSNWADTPVPLLAERTPREAIKSPEGLQQVKFLLHTYEHSEAEQAKAQQRAPVSYDFLWQQLGITP